jgi:hypothetical protein
MQKMVTLDIPETGECPKCGYKHGDWIPYVCPEEGEIGIFCPMCCTHFKDQELSLEEFGLIE